MPAVSLFTFRCGIGPLPRPAASLALADFAIAWGTKAGGRMVSWRAPPDAVPLPEGNLGFALLADKREWRNWQTRWI